MAAPPFPGGVSAGFGAVRGARARRDGRVPSSVGEAVCLRPSSCRELAKEGDKTKVKTESPKQGDLSCLSAAACPLILVTWAVLMLVVMFRVPVVAPMRMLLYPLRPPDVFTASSNGFVSTSKSLRLPFAVASSQQHQVGFSVKDGWFTMSLVVSMIIMINHHQRHYMIVSQQLKRTRKNWRPRQTTMKIPTRNAQGQHECSPRIIL